VSGARYDSHRRNLAKTTPSQSHIKVMLRNKTMRSERPSYASFQHSLSSTLLFCGAGLRQVTHEIINSISSIWWRCPFMWFIHDDDGLETGLKLVGPWELRRSVCAEFFYCCYLVPVFLWFISCGVHAWWWWSSASTEVGWRLGAENIHLCRFFLLLLFVQLSTQRSTFSRCIDFFSGSKRALRLQVG
jgi:hypothetical protein